MRSLTSSSHTSTSNRRQRSALNHENNPPPTRNNTKAASTHNKPSQQIPARARPLNRVQQAQAEARTRLLQPRRPLAARDGNQNAPSLTSMTTRPSISSASSKMPAGGDNRSRQPHLGAAAAAKGTNRTPITPKIAARPNIQPVVSPLVRRPLGHQTITATTSNSAAAPQHQNATRDEVASPVASFIATNITPRSGSRQGRVDSTSSTPTGTPNPERNSEGWDARGGLGVSTLSFDSSRPHSYVDGQRHESNESKFFFASDAKTTTQPPPRPVSVPQKSSTFFYADGSTANNKKAASPPGNTNFTPTLVSTPEPLATKFFYANGAPDPPVRPTLSSHGSAYGGSNVSRQASSRPGTSYSATGPPPPVLSRPISPVKSTSTPSVVSSLKSRALSPGPMANAPVQSPPSMAPTTNPTAKRRVSIEVPPREPRGHGRNSSIPTLDPPMALKLTQSPRVSDGASPPVSPGASYKAMTMASILQAVEDMGNEEDIKDGDSQPELQSPTKSVHSGDAISELVANARRERKVQDLEITNASLEAINRTLERQLRKQKAELRRYRRLSRSNRFSLASAASSRVPSETLTEPPAGLTDLSEEDDTEDEDLDSLDESELSESETASVREPLSPAAKVLVRRKRDERRLQLDLSKHQELLIDSQKINQSIKRCLDWTEELIKEGQKALAYHVRVSDVEVGGRVLAPLDEDEADEGVSHQEEDSVIVADTSSLLEPPWQKDGQDRDSGIELPVDRSSLAASTDQTS